MMIGVLQFYFTRRYLGGAGINAAPIHAAGSTTIVPRSKEWLRLGIGVAVLVAVLAALCTGAIPVNAVTLAQGAVYVIVAMAVLYFAYYFFIADLTSVERKRGVAMLVLFAGCALFFSGYEQAGSSLNLFAERYTDRAIDWLHFVIPTAWFQSLNSFFIFLFAPFFAWAWIALAKRNLNPSAPAKFRARRHPDGIGFPGHGGRRFVRCRRLESAAVLADPHVPVAHFR